MSVMLCSIYFTEVQNVFTGQHLPTRFNRTKSFLQNAKNTDGNGINGQNTHTIHREKEMIRKS